MGIIATSPAIGITVVAPSIVITAPTNGASFPAPWTGTITAVVTNPPSGVNTVTFYVDGVAVGTSTTIPYSRSVTLPAGTHVLLVTLTDALGTVTSSTPITISVISAVTTIRITAPSQGAVFPPGSVIAINAEVTNGPSTPVEVEFLDNGVVIGTDATVPYGITAPLAVGAHSLVARLIDAVATPVNCVQSPFTMASAGPWGPCQPNGTQSRTEIWTRSIITPPSGGGTPCGPDSETRVGTQSCTYVPPIPPPTGVYSEVNMVYKGMYRVPSMLPFPNTDFSFSQAFITPKYVSGALHILMSGPEFTAGIGGAAGLVELIPPATNTLTSDPTTCPSATFVRRWPISIYSNIVVYPGNNPRLSGIHYVANDYGNGTQLFWTYANAYGDPGYFPNVSTMILNDAGTAVGYGPWGSNDIGWEGLCGWLLNIPASVQAAGACGPLGIGAQVRGNAGSSPWGVNLQAFTPVAVATPPDTFATKTLTTKPVVYHDMAHPQARNANYRFCGPNSPNQAYDPAIQACPAGQYLSASNDGFPAIPPGTPPPVPFFGLSQQSFPGMGVTLDWIDCMCWVEDGVKTGVFAFGQLAETISIANGFTYNKVYTGSDPTHAHVGYGSIPCCHGQNDPSFQANGPFAGSLTNRGWILDPAQLVEILNGTRQPYAAVPTSTFVMHSVASGIPEERLVKVAFGAAIFDPATHCIHLSEQQRILDGFDPVPVVHVIELTQA
jgi:hypothetical protein